MALGIGYPRRCVCRFPVCRSRSFTYGAGAGLVTAGGRCGRMGLDRIIRTIRIVRDCRMRCFSDSWHAMHLSNVSTRNL